MKKINLTLGLLIGLVVFLIQSWPEKQLKLFFCDVGQGDAILIEYEDKQLLIDGGPDNSVLSCLGKNMPFWDRTIEMVVLTHPQSDHLAGLIEVVKRYEIVNFASSKIINDSADFWQLQEELEQKKVKRSELVAGNELKLGEVKLRVLWPPFASALVLGAKSGEAVNEVSSVLLGSFGRFNFLLTGDLEGGNEKILLANQSLDSVDLLKVAHHGSKYSTSREFLERLKPVVAVISVGKNHFGHPTQETLSRLNEVKAQIWRTDEKGEIEVVSDGQKWWIKNSVE